MHKNDTSDVEIVGLEPSLLWGYVFVLSIRLRLFRGVRNIRDFKYQLIVKYCNLDEVIVF